MSLNQLHFSIMLINLLLNTKTSLINNINVYSILLLTLDIIFYTCLFSFSCIFRQFKEIVIFKGFIKFNNFKTSYILKLKRLIIFSNY